jgi:hypothetical protein
LELILANNGKDEQTNVEEVTGTIRRSSSHWAHENNFDATAA